MFCEFDKFSDATGYKMPSDASWRRIRRPVINVSWEDAMAYIDWLSQQTGKRYRLPSEAEWEYAARSGEKDEKWAGTSSLTELDAYAWYGQNSSQRTHPVGSKKPNDLGLYDMSGNVWEWVQDFWHESYEGAPADGSVWEEGGNEGHVVRGGSWRDWPDYLRLAHRYWGKPDFRYFVIGFRVARDI
ncbi:MAG: SUMF1/EgtB/PvdO family nonheme iron enzyme [Desulfuromonadaceae bacterium]